MPAQRTTRSAPTTPWVRGVRHERIWHASHTPGSCSLKWVMAWVEAATIPSHAELAHNIASGDATARARSSQVLCRAPAVPRKTYPPLLLSRIVARAVGQHCRPIHVTLGRRRLVEIIARASSALRGFAFAGIVDEFAAAVFVPSLSSSSSSAPAAFGRFLPEFASG